MKYEMYVGTKLVATAESLVEVYRYSKVIETLGLVHKNQPLARMRGYNLAEGFICSYILFEVDRKLYIRPLKVIKCQSNSAMMSEVTKSILQTTSVTSAPTAYPASVNGQGV